MKAVFKQYVLESGALKEGTHWVRRRYQAGDEIIRQGDVSDSIFYVEEGVVRVQGRITLDDRRLVSSNVCDLGAGEVFGEVALLDRHPRSASVVAQTECRVIEVSGRALRAYMEAHPEAGFKLTWALAEILVSRLRDTNKKIFSLHAWGLKAHRMTDV